MADPDMVFSNAFDEALAWFAAASAGLPIPPVPTLRPMTKDDDGDTAAPSLPSASTLVPSPCPTSPDRAHVSVSASSSASARTSANAPAAGPLSNPPAWEELMWSSLWAVVGTRADINSTTTTW